MWRRIWNVCITHGTFQEPTCLTHWLGLGRFCSHVSKASLIEEDRNHRFKEKRAWGCSCVLLTELGVCHQVGQSSSCGVGVQGCVCSGVCEGPPTRVGRGGWGGRWGGRTLDDTIEPVLDGWVAVALVGGGGGQAALAAQRALVFWCWRRVCVWQVETGPHHISGQTHWAVHTVTGKQRKPNIETGKIFLHASGLHCSSNNQINSLRAECMLAIIATDCV